LKLSQQHSRQVARVEGGLLHYYAAHDGERCICSSTTAAATTAHQLQCQAFKSNNQPVMIALTTGCAPLESSDVRQRQVVDAEAEGWAAEPSGRRWKQVVEWRRQVVDAVAEWWAAEANGGGVESCGRCCRGKC